MVIGNVKFVDNDCFGFGIVGDSIGVKNIRVCWYRCGGEREEGEEECEDE